MNDIQTLAFELRLDELRLSASEDLDLSGCMLAACSAHDPSPKKQMATIKYLIDSGVSVNETDKNGVTPLHRAVRFRSLAAVDLVPNQKTPWQRALGWLVYAQSDRSQVLMTSNPSVRQRPDGKILMVYKTVGKKFSLPSDGPVVHMVAIAESPTGPFTKLPNPLFTLIITKD